MTGQFVVATLRLSPGQLGLHLLKIIHVRRLRNISCSCLETLGMEPLGTSEALVEETHQRVVELPVDSPEEGELMVGEKTEDLVPYWLRQGLQGE